MSRQKASKSSKTVARVLIGLANEVRKLDAERRKIEERLGGIQPMKPTYRKQLETRLKNVKAKSRDLIVEMGFVKRVIDIMAGRSNYSTTARLSAKIFSDGCEPVAR